jgi:hypothetical protein
MVDINLGALTIPVFTTIFGAGWGACYAIVVRPLTAELQDLKTKVAAVEKDKDERIKKLEVKLGIWTD